MGPRRQAISSTLPVPGVVVRGLDQVLRAGEGDFAVDHHDLAVVAQVGPAPLTVDRPQRQHGTPADLAGLEPGDQLAVPLDPQGAQVVEEQAHFDSALGGFLQGCQEFVGDVVGAHDVELRVDEILRLADGRRHGRDGIRIAGQQVHPVAVHHRQGTQRLVQFGGGGHPLRAVVMALQVRQL
jgi:hypothetical protein